MNVANKLNISQRVLCSYEKGTRTMPVVMLPKIAKILNVPETHLLGIEKRMLLDERTRQAKIINQLEKVQKLPINDQKSIFNIINSLIDKNLVNAN